MTKVQELCIACGAGKYHVQVQDLTVETPEGFEVCVPEVTRWRCAACGDEVVPPASHHYIDRYVAGRQEQLSPEDVRRIFARLGDRQADVCEALGLGTKTLGRWLAGTQHPNRAMGFYLRAAAEFPLVYEWIGARGWQQSPAPVPGAAEVLAHEFKFDPLPPDAFAQPNFASDFRQTCLAAVR